MIPLIPEPGPTGVLEGWGAACHPLANNHPRHSHPLPTMAAGINPTNNCICHVSPLLHLWTPTSALSSGLCDSHGLPTGLPTSAPAPSIPHPSQSHLSKHRYGPIVSWLEPPQCSVLLRERVPALHSHEDGGDLASEPLSWLSGFLLASGFSV